MVQLVKRSIEARHQQNGGRMLIVLSAIIILLLLVETIFLPANLLLAIMGTVLAIGGLVEYIFVKAIKKSVRTALLATCMILSVVIVSLSVDYHVDKKGTRAYAQSKVTTLAEKISKEDPETVRARVNSLEENRDQYTDKELYVMGDICIDAGYKDEAKEVLNEYYNDDSVEYYSLLIKFYRTFEPNDSLIRTLTSALADNPTWAEGAVMLGMCLLDDEREGDAMYYFNKAITLKPEDPYPYIYMGVAYMYRGRYDKAKEYLGSAAALNQGDKDITATIDGYLEIIRREEG